uniref:Putative ovule protein n=1 Tax=Solanum chacoense TaxID=4108 RepID=A0A0V0HSB6_SOLCH
MQVGCIHAFSWNYYIGFLILDKLMSSISTMLLEFCLPLAIYSTRNNADAKFLLDGLTNTQQHRSIKKRKILIPLFFPGFHHTSNQ